MGEVCDLIAGGDVPKGEFSQVVTEEYRIPIYSNGIGEKALYGFTKSPRITQPCVTISARGTIGYSALHLTPFYPVVRLIAAIPYKCLDVKYLFYMLQMTTFKIPQTGIPQLTIPMVKTYSIPIPPLETQAKSSQSSTGSMRSAMTSRRGCPPRSPPAKSSTNTIATSSSPSHARRNQQEVLDRPCYKNIYLL